MSIKITTVAEMTKSSGVKILAYGFSGVGKTYAISALPNPMIFSTEDGLLSLAKDFGHLSGHAIATYQGMTEALAWAASAESAKYSHIVLDSFSDLAEIILADQLSKTKDGRQAYGETNNIVLKICRMIRHLPRNVYMTAKEGQLVDADGIAKFGPMFPGKTLAAQVPYFFDEVFQLIVQEDAATKERHRWFRTAGSLQYVAKDRSGRLDPWEYADLSAVFNKIQGV